jgi:hypothetical protein
MTGLPPYTHTPGITTHPNNIGGHMEAGEGLHDHQELLDEHWPQKNKVYLYSLELFNHGYYWETHVYLEHLWNLHGRKGVIADFLKAFIKLCACGVKLRVGEEKLARQHLEAFKSSIDALNLTSDYYCGINIKEMMSFELPEKIERLTDGTPKVFWKEIGLTTYDK